MKNFKVNYKYNNILYLLEQTLQHLLIQTGRGSALIQGRRIFKLNYAIKKIRIFDGGV